MMVATPRPQNKNVLYSLEDMAEAWDAGFEAGIALEVYGADIPNPYLENEDKEYVRLRED